MYDKKLIRTVIIALAAICLCAPGAFAKPLHKSDRDRDELRGAVKSVATAQEVTDTDNDKTTVHEISIGEEDYDLDGNLTLDKTYMTDFVRERTPERIDARTTAFHSEMGDSIEHYKFDAAGNMVEKAVSYGTDPKAPADETRRYKFDKHGRMIEQQLIDRDGKIAEQHHLYARRQGKHHPPGRPVERRKAALSDFDLQLRTRQPGQLDQAQPNGQQRSRRGLWQYSESQHGPLVRTIGYFDVKPAPVKLHRRNMSRRRKSQRCRKRKNKSQRSGAAGYHDDYADHSAVKGLSGRRE